jgi:hypothetical protein
MKTKSITKATLLSIFVMSVITAVTLNSCQKEKSIQPKVTTKASAAHPSFPKVTAIFDQINSLVFSGQKTKGGFWSNVHGMDSSGCITVVQDTISKPHTTTFTYTAGCIENDGKMRSGTIVLSYNDPDIRTVNNAYGISYQNYQAGDSSVFNGTMSITNTGPNGSGNLVLLEQASYTVTNGSSVLTVNGNFPYEWVAGESSQPYANLQFNVTGGLKLTFNTGDSLVQNVTSTLVKNCKTSGCNYTIAGVSTSTTYSVVNGISVETDDFGNPGGCSGQYALTQNGITTIVSQ